ncbi:MAG: M15 family metallopeptidase [Bacteroidales bacterium]|nr:M15 family metallopeptidase [Bacteroidales bacterium]
MKKIASILPIIIALLCCTNCKHPKLPAPAPTPQKDTVKQIVTKADTLAPDTETEAAMRALGLVDIQEIEPTIQVHLVYSTPDNFTHTILYKDIHKAFMLPVVADILKRAQAQLKAQHPDYSLLVYDAARPLSVQWDMWEVAEATNTTYYVADPRKAQGLHNYGAAVDITIVDGRGDPISMGTPFDWFGVEAHITHEDSLVKSGAISQQELDNRLLLRKLMTDNGMLTIRSEWWHFELMRGPEAQKTFKLIE